MIPTDWPKRNVNRTFPLKSGSVYRTRPICSAQVPFPWDQLLFQALPTSFKGCPWGYWSHPQAQSWASLHGSGRGTTRLSGLKSGAVYTPRPSQGETEVGWGSLAGHLLLSQACFPTSLSGSPGITFLINHSTQTPSQHLSAGNLTLDKVLLPKNKDRDCWTVKSNSDCHQDRNLLSGVSRSPLATRQVTWGAPEVKCAGSVAKPGFES